MLNSTSIINGECLGVVLAGGLSSRMGQDKAQLLRNKNANFSMLDFSKKLLSDSGLSNIVVSGDNYDVPDLIKKSGPVGGILSVLAQYPHAKSLLILPVDLPFITAKALENLRLKGELTHKATYFEGHNIPLYLPNNAYVELFLTQAFTKTTRNKDDSTQLGDKTKKHGPSIKALLNQIPSQAIKSDNIATLFNTNTPEQWQQATQKFSL